jgi:single-strand DNA-binding protein
MNKVILIGRITKDLELKGIDKKYTKFTVAVNRMSKDDGTDFINCVAFGKTAEVLAAYTKKGHRIALEGRLSVSNYEKDGQKIWSTEVMISNIEFLESKGTDVKQPQQFRQQAEDEFPW